MWWYKIPALLVVAATSHISLSNQKLAKLRLKSSFVAYWLFAFRVRPFKFSPLGGGIHF